VQDLLLPGRNYGGFQQRGSGTQNLQNAILKAVMSFQAPCPLLFHRVLHNRCGILRLHRSVRPEPLVGFLIVFE